MKIRRILTLTLLSLFLVACGDSNTKLTKDSAEIYEQVVEILKSAKDEATATEAIESLKAFKEDFQDLKDRSEKLKTDEEEPQTEEEMRKEVGDELFERMTKIMEDLTKETTRISEDIFKDPSSDYAKKLTELVKTLGEVQPK